MSTENEDIKEWIIRVIDSCTNSIHLEYCQNLIDLYHKKNNNEKDWIELQDSHSIKYKF